MMTGVGMILGTAAYMARSRRRGATADKRSDIWAFGCVLYEMLTGDAAVRRRGRHRHARRRAQPRAGLDGAAGRRAAGRFDAAPTLSREGSPQAGCRHRRGAVRARRARELASARAAVRAPATRPLLAARRHARGRRAGGRPRVVGAAVWFASAREPSAACGALDDHAVRCRRADHQRRRPRPRDHARRHTHRLSSATTARSCSSARSTRSSRRGWLSRRAARAVRLARRPVGRLRRRHHMLKKVAITGGPAITLARSTRLPAARPGRRTTRSSSRPTTDDRPAARLGGGRADDGADAARPRSGEPITSGRRSCRAAGPCSSRSRRSPADSMPRRSRSSICRPGRKGADARRQPRALRAERAPRVYAACERHLLRAAGALRGGLRPGS